MDQHDLIILTRDPKLWSCQKFSEYCQNNAISYRFLNPFTELTHEIWDLRPKKVLLRSSGVLFDDIDLRLAAHWEALGSHVLNSPSNIEIFRNKEKAYFYLQSLGLKLIPTSFLRGEQDFTAQRFSNGVVFKPVRGNKGIGVKIFDSQSEAQDFWRSSYPDQRYLIQPKIDDFNELRIFIFNDQVQDSFYKEDFNHYVNFPELFSLSLKHSKEFQLSYSAWDWIQYDGEWLLNEVNLSPGFQKLNPEFLDPFLNYLLG